MSRLPEFNTRTLAIEWATIEYKQAGRLRPRSFVTVCLLFRFLVLLVHQRSEGVVEGLVGGWAWLLFVLWFRSPAVVLLFLL